MSKGFSINDILGSQSAPPAPAGLKMQNSEVNYDYL